MVTIRVGTPPIESIVHEEILKTATDSKFFQVAFNNGFKETQTGILELPEDDPKAFRVLLNWVYGTATGFIKCEKKSFFQAMDTSTLLKLYVLASKYAMDTLHDAIITHLWWRNTQATCWLQLGLTQDALSYFEANTMADCPLDKLLVDWMTDDALGCKSSRLSDYHGVFGIMPDRLMRAAFVKVNLACYSPPKDYYGNSHTSCSFKKQKGTLCSYHCHGKNHSCPAPQYS